MTDDKMIDKITKLLNKAEKAGTDEEAEAFSAKAQELMTKWAIDEMTVAAARGKAHSSDKIVIERVPLGKTYADEDCRLYDRVAKCNNVRVAFDSYGKRATLVGYQSDVTNVKLLVGSLLIQCGRQCNRQAKAAFKPGMSAFDKYVWRRSFKDAFASSVGQRLKAAMQTVINEVDDGSLVPMLRNRADEVDEFTKDLGWGVGRASTRRADWDGMAAGSAAGRKADVGSPKVNSGVRGALGR